MFWQTTEENSLRLLLKTDEISLQSVLDDPYTLQELRNSYDVLIKYLCKEDILVNMLETALCPTIDESLPLKEQYKYANMCTEVLTVPSLEITAAIFSSEKCMGVVSSCVEKKMNSLVASFFMKIISHLFTRDTGKMLDLLVPTPFLTTCISQLELSSIGEVLLRILMTPSDPDHIERTLNWFTNGGLIEGLVSLLSFNNHPLAQYNAAYLYSEIVRSLRDVLYSSDEKSENILLLKMQNKETVSAIIDGMLKKDLNGDLCESCVVEGHNMVHSLLETNFVPNRPSHLLEEDRIESWMGGVPDNPNCIDGVKVWQADADRIAEGAVVSRSEDILKVIVHELNKDVSHRSSCWKYLLDLIIEMVDTNWNSTHSILRTSFQSIPLTKLLDACIANPQLSILHEQVYKLIEYILNSACVPESSLIICLFNETDIIGWIRKHLTECTSTPLSSKQSQLSIHSFLLHLGCAFQHARMMGPNRERIDAILKASTKWHELTRELDEFTERNRMVNLDDGIPSLSSSRNHNSDMDISPSAASSQMAQAILHEFESRSPCQQLPTHLDAPLSVMSTPFEKQCYSIDTAMRIDITDRFVNGSIDESSFENICTLKNNGIDEDEWPRSGSNPSNIFNTTSSHNDWPGIEESTSGESISKKEEDWPGDWNNKGGDDASVAFPVEWNTKEIKGEQLTDDWPLSVISSPSISRGNDNDEVSSPPSNQSSSRVWDDISSSSPWSSSNDPVMAAIASGMISASMEKTTNSEC